MSLQGLKLSQPTAEQEAAIKILPEALRPYYLGYWLFSTLDPNPYANWTPPKAPWKFCYNDSFQGNSWRQAALAKYKALLADLQKQGMVKGDLVVTNSNNDINVQLAQLNNLVREGCDVILSIPSSPTGLCSGLKEARAKGVLVVTVESEVSCPEAINVGFNEYYVAAKTAKWVADSWAARAACSWSTASPAWPRLSPGTRRRWTSWGTIPTSRCWARSRATGRNPPPRPTR